MKKTLLILLVLIFIFPLYSEDKCRIFASPLGAYTLPWSDGDGEYIVYFNKDGSLNEEHVNDIAHHISWQGANSVREFSFWPHRDLIIIRYMGKGYAEFEKQYFQNWRRIVEIYNSYGIRVYIELFDYCGTRKKFRNWNPWNIPLSFGGSNVYNAGNFFWGPESKWLRDIFIAKITKTFDGLDVGYGVCNEPRLPDVPAKFLADTFCTLINLQALPRNIILPIEYNRKESDPSYAEFHRNFRDLVVKKLKNKKWAQWFKSRCISPCHGMTLENLKSMLGPNPPKGGTRNLKLSMDGWRNPRPTKAQVKEVFAYALEKKSKAALNGKIHFEVIYGKQKEDPLDSVKGVSEIYKDFFGNWPENYHKYEKKTIKPEPKASKIVIISPIKDETWKSGESHAIAWKTAGSVGNIKIEYSKDKGTLWIIITPSTGNDGVHAWIVPNLPAGDCLIRVSEVDGSLSDVTTFTTTGKPVPAIPKKKNKTWIYAVGAAIVAVAVFCFIKYTTITAMVLGVLLLFVSYFGYRKKWKHYYVYLIAAYLLILVAGLLTNNPILMKALFGSAMIIIFVLSLIMDKQHKKIKNLDKSNSAPQTPEYYELKGKLMKSLWADGIKKG